MRSDELRQLLLKDYEDEHLECKEAKEKYSFDEFVKYCAAFSNEGGGRLVLGITDKPPRLIVGTRAFQNLDQVKLGLVDHLHIRIDVEEIIDPDGRVLIFRIPPRSIGMPIGYKGAYWMRAGESLKPMPPDMLRRIFDESGPDFSAEICRKTTREDLNPAAIEHLRSLWIKKSGKKSLAELSDDQILEDLELVVNGQSTFAALVLLGTRSGLGKHLPQSEIIFEFRSTPATGPAQQRKEYREGFLLSCDDLWETVNLRNDIQHYQDGLFVWDVPTFSEQVVREAVVNAICHRDYRLGGSVFIRQYQRMLEIVSPGGFPAGITKENILWRQLPRNRRIAEVLARCGMVERAGQGVNLMYEECIKQGKDHPDFSGSDDYQVMLTLHGEVRDPQFLKFLEKLGKERMESFSTDDLLAIDAIHRESKIAEQLRKRLPHLIDAGVIERVGRGRYTLSKRFYHFLGKKGVYTRKRGLDRDHNKALLEKHIKDDRQEGCQFQELQQVLPNHSRNQIHSLLKELRAEGKIRCSGRTRGGRWFPETSSCIAPKKNGK
jgi:ATP-dependent DNA helicase RecG